MGFQIRVTVRYEGLDEVIRRAPEFDGIVMDLISADIQAGAKDRAAVKTGFMRDHIERYPEAHSFRVVAEADYSGYVNYGTRKMAAQPFMEPAVEAADADGACQQALKQIGL